METLFFSTPDELRKWFFENHEKLDEQWIGYYKKGSGKPSITWPESVDEALCFGWIDGIRKSIEAERYKIRFTPRRKGSIWSSVNIKRVAELTKQGLMQPAGIAAFKKRDAKKSEIYSFEQQDVKFDDAHEQIFKENQQAWDFFQQQPAHYKKAATWWVISAKQEATRQKRLNQLISDSESGERIKKMRRG